MYFNPNTMTFATESVASQLKKDANKIDPRSGKMMTLSSLYNVYMNKDALKKYEDKFHQLSAVNKDAKKLRGYMYFYKGDLVAFFSIDIRDDKTWIDTLTVSKQYRGKLLSHQLLDVAVKDFKATDIRISADNDYAIHVFKNYGFNEYDKKGKFVYMTINMDGKPTKASESTNLYYVASTPITGEICTSNGRPISVYSTIDAALEAYSENNGNITGSNLYVHVVADKSLIIPDKALESLNDTNKLLIGSSVYVRPIKRIHIGNTKRLSPDGSYKNLWCEF